ncbi:MAG TPA: hypothetical protein VLS89_05470, partial [Candidatus Nanopelagicales bacterium]|nr:hypothetical protein [Candidatus Nanopelagicales bacterium]
RRNGLGAARLALGALAVAGASGAFGCLQRPIEPIEPRTTATIVERLTQSSVDKIDLLLAIDNSRSMADKQDILALAVPDLVQGLVNPPCIDPTNPAIKQNVPSPTDDCPNGLEREFEPVLDIHIGILSSSIGGYGADVCEAASPATQSNNDKGRLLARTAPDQTNDLGPSTYDNKLFLAWDPSQKKAGEENAADPGDGEADLETDSMTDLNTTALIPVLSQMVRGLGQVGCGYEAQLESWYRFLVDPEPYDTLEVVNDQATPQGVDAQLLQQRADFMRPSSLLAIIILTDENDCSIREGGQYFFAAQQTTGSGGRFHLPRPRSECAVNPNDPCCMSCGQDMGACPQDPTCYVNGDPAQGVAALTDLEDAANQRCFDQKRRFGIDFLYPIDRYTQALTSAQIQNRKGDIVANPLFSDLNPGDDVSAIRDPGLVFVAGIVGVPWQDIARDPTNLSAGFKSSDELLAPVGNFGNTWEVILGDPENFVKPADPFMQESIDPRTGTNPITGDAITAPNGGTNPINGNEWIIDERKDLQYACIFPLIPGTERDCSVAGTPACDCEDGTSNPLCAPDPVTGQTTLQVRAKAYPGLRELQLIRSVGGQGIVGSVCPAQLDDQTSPDFGYRPAIGAIIDRLKTALGGQCLPRSLQPDDNGQVSCLIIEARKAQGECTCDEATGRRFVPEAQRQAQSAIEADPLAEPSGWNCYCEVQQLLGDNDPNTEDPLYACQYDVQEPVQSGGQDVNGWCYVDATTSPPVGDQAIVANCPATERRLIRFVGQGEAQPGATLFITCAGEPGE